MNSFSQKKLYLFVENFSSPDRESFFEKELPFLCERFDEVVVVPLYPENVPLNFKSKNIRVLQFDYFQPVNRVKLFILEFRTLTKILVEELFRTHNKLFYLRPSILNDLLLKVAAAKKLQAVIEADIEKGSVFYTYWFKQWTMALSIIKMSYPNLKLVSRVHGGDYDEGQIKSILPFRYFQLSKVEHIYPVSEFAKNYLVTKFAVKPSKITTSRLGLDLPLGHSPIEPSILQLVSCSSVIPLKRLELLAEVIKNIKTPVRWIHFGDGPLLAELKKIQFPSQHMVEFKGHVANEQFINYLQTQPISLFVNVSESEGIPVSIMEAISQGIPIIGTAVCGVPEIVTSQTGFLFPVDFDPKYMAAHIESKHQGKDIYSKQFREQITNFYKNNFSEENHITLSTYLSNL